MASSEKAYERVIHPIDLVEQLAVTYDWATDRAGDDELTWSSAATGRIIMSR